MLYAVYEVYEGNVRITRITRILRIRRISQEYSCVFKGPQSLPRQFLPYSDSQNTIGVKSIGQPTPPSYTQCCLFTPSSYIPSPLTSPPQFKLQGSVTTRSIQASTFYLQEKSLIREKPRCVLLASLTRSAYAQPIYLYNIFTFYTILLRYLRRSRGQQKGLVSRL